MQLVQKIRFLPLLATLALILAAPPVLAQQPADALAGGKANLYSGTVTPLTPEECGRCHTTHYGWLRDNGGRHQGVACLECHEIIHAYNPRRNNYDEIMPQCFSCHDVVHGAADPLQRCLACHANPHQPLRAIPAPAELEDRCRLCHGEVAASLQAEVSMHTELACSSCHSGVHGRIPRCDECHGNHSPLAALATPDCLACHPVHTPLLVSYPVTEKQEVCGGCHNEAYNLLQQAPTKHSLLTCARCHPQHGEVPACQNCHGEPHSAAIHAKYASCGVCHNIAHAVQK